MAETRDVVLTGYGVCTRWGDWEPLRAALRVGAGRPFDTWEPAVQAGLGCQLIGLFPHELSADSLGITKQEARFMGRAAMLALRATRAALAQSALDPAEAAVVVGSGTGDVATHREIDQRLARDGGARRVLPTVIPRLMASTVSANLATVLRAKGPSFSASAACAGGAYNLLLAAELIRAGHVRAAIAGGVEVADLHFYAGFDSMRAYTSVDNDNPVRASRPFAADRAGFIFAEGAGVVVLEDAESARHRGAEVLGRLRGWGMSSDGTGSMVAPGEGGAERAIQNALDHARLPADRVGYVNAHATSTPVGDVSEARAIRRAFGPRLVPYSSTKGYTGHTISGAGAIEAIATWVMLREGWIAPSVNAAPVDPEIADHPPVLKPLTAEVDVAISNSFGFGGTNAVLVLEGSRTAGASG